MSSSLFFHLIVTVVRLENGPDATVNIDVLKSAPAKVPAVRTGNLGNSRDVQLTSCLEAICGLSRVVLLKPASKQLDLLRTKSICVKHALIC